LNNENNRNLSVSEDGTYHCIITNPDYPSQNNITTGKYTMINAGPFLNDSTAIANIYLQNLNNSLSWDLNTPISTWEGVTHSGNPLERITGLVINNKNITILPTSINQLDALEVLQIQENNLTFEEIEKITQTPPASFNYSPQNKIGKSQIIEHSGNPIVISLP
ncbi:hypothetical protein, partial [Flammeovirga sp. EKP202]|uniref:hypothetical protein n=1 Tax=Flammeovirga sp. EKP202 TaxID=2770592 RepID=UPI001984A5E2